MPHPFGLARSLARVAGSRAAEGLMDDIKDNAFIALYLGLTAVVTFGWVGVIGYGVWHFLFG